jgi:AcrR family transcriptional regulator
VSLGSKEAAVKSTRSYSSPLRAAQAQETRRRVLAAARDLFVAQGYPTTTIAAVARRAKVSADTIYSVFGSKTALLKEVLDVVVAGDDEDVAVLDRTEPQAMRAEPDQRTQLGMFAAGMTGQLERIRPLDDVLRSAAAVDAAAAELRADLQVRQRRTAIATVVSWVAAHGPLRLPEEEATAITWTLTSPEVHQMLRDTWGWPRERYERWLRETLTSSLLP